MMNHKMDMYLALAVKIKQNVFIGSVMTWHKSEPFAKIKDFTYLFMHCFSMLVKVLFRWTTIAASENIKIKHFPLLFGCTCHYVCQNAGIATWPGLIFLNLVSSTVHTNLVQSKTRKISEKVQVLFMQFLWAQDISKAISYSTCTKCSSTP